MSQMNTNICECDLETVTVPVRGLSFELDKLALGTGGASGDAANLQLGVETKRNIFYNGKQVYSQLIDFGSGPNKTTKTINHNIPDVEWIQVDHTYSVVIAPNGNVNSPSTYASATAVGPIVLAQYASVNLSGHRCVFCVVYTKTTDPVIS